MEKQRWEESGKRRAEDRRSEKRKSEKKEVQVREKVATSRNTVFFQWFVAPEGRKVGSLKWRVGSHVDRWEMKNCNLLWREAHFQVKMCKTHHSRSTFGSWDVEKVHAVVAESTFRSQNVQNTMLGALLEVEMSKKCTPLWREAHCQVKRLINGPDNPTCQLLPTSSKRKVKMAWGKQEREKRWWRIGVEQVVCGRVSTSKLCMDKLCCMHACMYACMHACMYVCMYVWMHIYIYMYLCMFVCLSSRLHKYLVARIPKLQRS